MNSDIDYLKSLVAQLNEKIKALEDSSPKALPAAQLRTILIGPPGAGKASSNFHQKLLNSEFQVKEPRRR